MMYPPVFSVCSADADVQSHLGAGPCRVFLFGYAEGVNGGPPQKPYAVWRIVSGEPENYLDKAPDADTWTLQFDVFGDTAYTSREAAKALRNAIEPTARS